MQKITRGDFRMELEAVEKGDRLIVNFQKNHTVANLVRKAIWENGEEAGYDKGNPLGEDSNLVIDADNPKEVLQEGIQTAQDWMDNLEDEV